MQPTTELDKRVEMLESEVQKKKTIIVEGDRRHNELLDKIRHLENRLESMDQPNRRDRSPLNFNDSKNYPA